MSKIKRITGSIFKQRLEIRQFTSSESMHKFLNTGDNACTWSEYNGNLPKGTYARVAGIWMNVKKLDPITLAHV